MMDLLEPMGNPKVYSTMMTSTFEYPVDFSMDDLSNSDIKCTIYFMHRNADFFFCLTGMQVDQYD